MSHTTTKNISLLDFLSELYPDSSKTTLRSWISDGRISIDGQVSKVPRQQVAVGQSIALDSKKKIDINGLIIRFQDKDIIVLEKPAGMLSVATAFDADNNVFSYLKEHFRPRRVYVVHRLDQETSGLMLFALNEKSRDQLKSAFEKHDVKREYTAIIEGKLEKKQGTWESILVEDETYRVRETDDLEKGRKAVTHYVVTAESPQYSLLKLHLETGRKNQIRAHCESAGHPIVGDKKYGSSKGNQLCLHAHRLIFMHPTTGKKMEFDAQVPLFFHRFVKINV